MGVLQRIALAYLLAVLAMLTCWPSAPKRPKSASPEQAQRSAPDRAQVQCHPT